MYLALCAPCPERGPWGLVCRKSLHTTGPHERDDATACRQAAAEHAVVSPLAIGHEMRCNPAVDTTRGEHGGEEGGFRAKMGQRQSPTMRANLLREILYFVSQSFVCSEAPLVRKQALCLQWRGERWMGEQT